MEKKQKHSCWRESAGITDAVVCQEPRKFTSGFRAKLHHARSLRRQSCPCHLETQMFPHLIAYSAAQLQSAFSFFN